MALSKISTVPAVPSVKSLVEPEKVIPMTFDMSDKDALLQAQLRLTDQYSNPIEATVRETVSNAMDAIASLDNGDNKEKLVEIKLEKDGFDNYVFSVSDKGVGMDEETVLNNYARYNASTKINDFDSIGAKRGGR